MSVGVIEVLWDVTLVLSAESLSKNSHIKTTAKGTYLLVAVVLVHSPEEAG